MEPLPPSQKLLNRSKKRDALYWGSTLIVGWIIAICVAYSLLTLFLCLIAGYIPWEGIQGTQHGVAEETLKMFSFTTHYPSTNDTQTAYLISFYLTSACARPANNSAITHLCINRFAWSPFNGTAILKDIDAANSFLPNSKNVTASQTTAMVSAALGHATSNGPFCLLVFGMLFTMAGIIFLPYFDRLRYALATFCLAIAVGMEVGGTLWLHSISNSAVQRMEGVETQYVRDAKAGKIIFGLLWSVTATAGVCAAGFAVYWMLSTALRVNMKDDQTGESESREYSTTGQTFEFRENFGKHNYAPLPEHMDESGDMAKEHHQLNIEVGLAK